VVAAYPRTSVRALRGVDFSAGAGLHLLLGPTGAGKTTLLRVLAGLLAPAAGTVRIGSCDVRFRPLAARQRLGYVPQEIGLPHELTLREYLDELLALDGEPPGAGRVARLHDAAAAVHLDGSLDHRLRRFSGGMRRRALLAQALVRRPAVLLCDEPTAGLDPEEQIAVHALLRGLARETTVVIASHFLWDAAALGGRATLLCAGRVVVAQPTAALLASATGQVWAVGGDVGPGPDYLLQPTAEAGLQRLLGAPPPGAAARPLPATLEDAYLLALHRARPGGAA